MLYVYVVNLVDGEMIFVVLSFAFAFWVAFSKMKSNPSNPSKENTPVLQSKAVQAEPATECFDESTSIANSKTSNISMVIMQNKVIHV